MDCKTKLPLQTDEQFCDHLLINICSAIFLNVVGSIDFRLSTPFESLEVSKDCEHIYERQPCAELGVFVG